MKMKKVKRYSDDFKKEVIKEFKGGKISKSELRRKYGIGGGSTILQWMRKFEGSVPKDLYMPKEKEKTLDQLKLEIEQLKHQLEYEKLKSKVFDKMIDIAEEEFQIPIRKKPGAKQSKK
jgi:transposase-like protein